MRQSTANTEAAGPLRGYATGQSVALDGQLEVLIEDYADGRSRTRHFLRTIRGRVELTFDRKPASIASGSSVRVRGRVQGDVLALDGTDGGSLQVVAAASSDTLGEQRVAVILVNFQDDSSQPITIAAANTLVFGTVSDHYRESSFEQTWFSGTTYGWVTIPMSKSICDNYRLAIEADQAVAAAGGDLSPYSRKVYLFPKNACGWAGLATVGGNATNAFVNGAFTLQIVGHELGHNYGLRHAHALDCDVSALGNTCTSLSYGDAADLMGNNRAGHFSPFAKEWLGWLNDGISPPIHTATTSGRYVIEPYSSGSVGPKAIRILRGTDGSGRRLWYYVEFRQPLGADAVLATTGNLTKGLIVRTATEGDADSSYQLDMSTGSAFSSINDFSDGALAVGQSHADALANLTITLASTSTDGASVDVLFGGGAPVPATCTRAAPSVALVGPTTAVAAGTLVAYTVTLTNRDSAACSASTFNLAGSVPTGWGGILAATTLSLSPGASASTAFNVTSAVGASAGGYSVGVGTGSSAGSVHTSSASASYSVAPTAAVLTESVATDKTSYLRGETVYMSARVLGNGAPVNGASVRFEITRPGGGVSVLTATTGSDGFARGTYKLGKAKTAIGSYQLRADASSGSGAATASTAFSAR